MKDLKNLILAGFLSLSKVEQQSIRDQFLESTDSVRHEQQKKQNELKLLSKKRFYQILEAADAFQYGQNKEHLDLLREARGLQDVDLIFSNDKVAKSMFDKTLVYKFRTNNRLGAVADTCHVKTRKDGQVVLTFFINTKVFPVAANSFRDLTMFDVDDRYRKYAYDIVSFEGVTSSGYDMCLSYVAKVVSNGTQDNYDDTPQILREDELSPYTPSTNYKLSADDFLTS